VRLNNRIYDPSYGTDYASLGEWEDASIAAFYKLTPGPLLPVWKAKLNIPNFPEIRVSTYP
jgi:hypothetical protein